MATLNHFTTLAVELAHTRALDESRAVAIQVATPENPNYDQTRNLNHSDTSKNTHTWCFSLIYLCIYLFISDGVVLQHPDRTEEEQGSHSYPAMFSPPTGLFPALPGTVAAHLLLQEKSASGKMSISHTNLRGEDLNALNCFLFLSFLSSVLRSVGAPSTGAQAGVADRLN